MAKASVVERNKKRQRLVAEYAAKRKVLKAKARDENISPEERFQARLKLTELPRNSSPVRVRMRCAQTGRPRGNYRKFGLSRIALRQLALKGHIPGMTKSSW